MPGHLFFLKYVNLSALLPTAPDRKPFNAPSQCGMTRLNRESAGILPAAFPPSQSILGHPSVTKSFPFYLITHLNLEIQAYSVYSSNRKGKEIPPLVISPAGYPKVTGLPSCFQNAALWSFPFSALVLIHSISLRPPCKQLLNYTAKQTTN